MACRSKGGVPGNGLLIQGGRPREWPADPRGASQGMACRSGGIPGKLPKFATNHIFQPIRSLISLTCFVIRVAYKKDHCPLTPNLSCKVQ